MAAKLCLSLAMLFAVAMPHVTAITNWEFIEMISPNIREIDSVSSETDPSENVIDLHGDPNDELDVEYVLRQMGLPYTKDGVTQVTDSRRLKGSKCRCSGYVCTCCADHSFRFIWKRVKMNACVDVEYLPKNNGFHFKIRYNGKTWYNQEVSVTNPPPLCYGLPGLWSFARICVQLYNVDVNAKSMCMKLQGVIDIRVHKFRVNRGFGCFAISATKRAGLNWMTQGEALTAAGGGKMQETLRDLLSYMNDLRAVER